MIHYEIPGIAYKINQTFFFLQNPSMNQLKQQQQFPVAPIQSQDPWAPVTTSNDNNQVR